MSEVAALRAVSHDCVVGIAASHFGVDGAGLIDLAERDRGGGGDDDDDDGGAGPAGRSDSASGAAVPVAYLLMPLRGVSLRAYVSDVGPIRGAGALLRLTECLSSALVAVHAAGYRHNDLTPESVLIEPSPGGGGGPDLLPRVVLCGFGSVSPDTVTPHTKWEANKVRAFHARRTPAAYRAPELWKVGRPAQSAADASSRGSGKFATITPAADAFGLGCVLFYAMFGKDAFGRKTEGGTAPPRWIVTIPCKSYVRVPPFFLRACLCLCVERPEWRLAVRRLSAEVLTSGRLGDGDSPHIRAVWMDYQGAPGLTDFDDFASTELSREVLDEPRGRPPPAPAAPEYLPRATSFERSFGSLGSGPSAPPENASRAAAAAAAAVAAANSAPRTRPSTGGSIAASWSGPGASTSFLSLRACGSSFDFESSLALTEVEGEDEYDREDMGGEDGVDDIPSPLLSPHLAVVGEDGQEAEREAERVEAGGTEERDAGSEDDGDGGGGDGGGKPRADRPTEETGSPSDAVAFRVSRDEASDFYGDDDDDDTFSPHKPPGTVRMTKSAPPTVPVPAPAPASVSPPRDLPWDELRSAVMGDPPMEEDAGADPGVVPPAPPESFWGGAEPDGREREREREETDGREEADGVGAEAPDGEMPWDEFRQSVTWPKFEGPERGDDGSFGMPKSGVPLSEMSLLSDNDKDDDRAWNVDAGPFGPIGGGGDDAAWNVDSRYGATDSNELSPLVRSGEDDPAWKVVVQCVAPDLSKSSPPPSFLPGGTRNDCPAWSVEARDVAPDVPEWSTPQRSSAPIGSEAEDPLWEYEVRNILTDLEASMSGTYSAPEDGVEGEEKGGNEAPEVSPSSAQDRGAGVATSNEGKETPPPSPESDPVPVKISSPLEDSQGHFSRSGRTKKRQVKRPPGLPSSTLYDLANLRQCAEVIARAEMHPWEAEYVDSEDGNSVLHLACEWGRGRAAVVGVQDGGKDSNTIRALLALTLAAPNMVLHRNRAGLTPLHTLCQWGLRPEGCDGDAAEMSMEFLFSAVKLALQEAMGGVCPDEDQSQKAAKGAGKAEGRWGLGGKRKKKTKKGPWICQTNPKEDVLMYKCFEDDAPPTPSTVASLELSPIAKSRGQSAPFSSGEWLLQSPLCVRDEEGHLPLHVALLTPETRHPPSVIKVLLRYDSHAGETVLSEDASGKTPLGIFCKRYSAELKALLTEAQSQKVEEVWEIAEVLVRTGYYPPAYGGHHRMTRSPQAVGAHESSPSPVTVYSSSQDSDDHSEEGGQCRPVLHAATALYVSGFLVPGRSGWDLWNAALCRNMNQAAMKDCHGHTPLQIALASVSSPHGQSSGGGEIGADIERRRVRAVRATLVVKALLDVHPQCKYEVDGKGRLPLKVALDAGRKADSMGAFTREEERLIDLLLEDELRAPGSVAATEKSRVKTIADHDSFHSSKQDGHDRVVSRRLFPEEVQLRPSLS